MDMLEGTVSAWYEAITFKRHWSPVDAFRLQQAFAYLLQNCAEWPSPTQFLDAVPRDKDTMQRVEAAAALRMDGPLETPTIELRPDNQDRIDAEITKCAELLRVNLTLDRTEQERRDRRAQHVDLRRPWGVDIDEWDPVTGRVIPKQHQEGTRIDQDGDP